MSPVLPMPEPRSRSTPDEGVAAAPAGASSSADALERRTKKKKDKVRSAWISFAGRIVAQVTGAVVSVALTLMVVHKVQKGQDTAQASAPPAKPAVSAPASPGANAGTTSPKVPAIAVLPLDNFSGDPARNAFANAMTEALIAELAQVPGVTVVSRTSAMQYRDAHKPLPEIARELGVTYVIEGSLVTERGRIRVTAQLIDAASDRHVWARTYDRPARDALGVQADVAVAIARDVGPVVVGENAR